MEGRWAAGRFKGVKNREELEGMSSSLDGLSGLRLLGWMRSVAERKSEEKGRNREDKERRRILRHSGSESRALLMDGSMTGWGGKT